nr:PREDICTED: LOW QUALITY PROTEIN: uncharacterized protein C6orf223 homolog [Bos mutus]
MMPLAEAGSRDQGGGPAGTEQARLCSAKAEVAAAKGAGDPAHCVLGSGEAPPAAPNRWLLARGKCRPLPGQESLLRSLCRPLRPNPRFRESDSAEPASFHLLQHTRSARENYSISAALLMCSNYPPPLSSAALSGIGPTRHN